MTAVGAIGVTWLSAALVLLGLGHVVELVAGVRLPPRTATVWLGLAVLVATLQVWSLVLPVDALVWLPVGLGSLVGWVLMVRNRRLRIPMVDRPRLAAAGVLVILLVLVANRAALPPLHYDTGLYHLNAVDYAHRYGTVVGLGNLHTRLGSSVSHFLLTAMAGVGPWNGAGYHVVNGGLAGLLFLETIGRISTGSATGSRHLVSQGLSVCLLAMLSLLVFVAPASLVSSPSLDLPAFVLVGASSLYLVDAVSIGSSRAALVAAGLAATAVSSRLQVGPLLAVVGVVLVVWVVRADKGCRRSSLVGLTVAAVIVVGASARTAMLSGYPFFPSTALPLPVSFRVPVEDGDLAARWVRSWARAPGRHPDEVLDSWAWLGPWWRAVRTSLFADAIGRMLLTASVVALVGVLVVMYRRNRSGPTIAVEGAAEEHGRRWSGIAAVATANVAAAAAWFLTAPDLRFAYGSLAMLAACVVAAFDLVLHRRRFPWAAAAAGLAIFVWLPGISNIGWIEQPAGSDPFGTGGSPGVEVKAFTTDSGLKLFVPEAGNQCWTHLWCTPEPREDLILRGKSRADGFMHADE